MFIRNIILFLIFTNLVICLSIEIVNYNIFPLLTLANINNNNIDFKFLIDTGSYYVDFWNKK